MGGRGPKPVEPRITGNHQMILAYIAKGMTNRQIAGLMDRSGYWVNGQLRIIFRLLDAHTRAQAVTVAVERGLLPGGPAQNPPR